MLYTSVSFSPADLKVLFKYNPVPMLSFNTPFFTAGENLPFWAVTKDPI